MVVVECEMVINYVELFDVYDWQYVSMMDERN